MKELVHCSIKNNIAFIEIDNPPVNALTNELIIQFRETITDLKIEEGIRAVIIYSIAHNNSFVAGADINKFLSLKTKEDGEEIALFYQSAIGEVASINVPVICAVEGLALGGGCELALGCDIRIAGENAQFGLTEVKIGILPGGGGTQRLSRLVGPGYAKFMIYSGMKINAREALRVGLIEKLVPPGKALKEATALAQIFSENAPNAIKYSKEVIDKGLDVSLEQGLEIEKQGVGKASQSGEPVVGGKAFKEKRKPVF